MAEQAKKRNKKYFVCLPMSRSEIRLKECDSPNSVDSYTRRNNFHNFVVIEGKDVTRLFRR